MIRLGGDRASNLFGDLRKAIGKLDGIVERRRRSVGETYSVVQYSVGGIELFTIRLLPGRLEACASLSRAEAKHFLGMRGLSAGIKEAIQHNAAGDEVVMLRMPLESRRSIKSFVNLVKFRSRFASSSKGVC